MAARQAADEFSAAAKNTLDKIEKKPLTQQILIGAASGLATGYVLARIGKTIALCIGVSTIGLQFLISRNQSTNELQNIEDDARETFERAFPVFKRGKSLPQKVTSLFKQNQVFFGSFGGGFLIGISFS